MKIIELKPGYDLTLADLARRYYYVVTDDSDKLIGGIGLAEFEFFKDCCELQKLYLADGVKGEDYRRV